MGFSVHSIRAQVTERSQFRLTEVVAIGSEWVFWVPPLRNVLKANFDVASWENGNSSVACIVRDYTGALLLAAGFLCDSNSSEEAKTRAACETICLLRGYYPDRQVWLEGDTLTVIRSLSV